MQKIITLLVCLASALAAQEPSQPPKLWWASLTAEAAASSTDAFTSLGKYELNPMLRGPNGMFSPVKASIFKGGLFAGTAVPQYFILRGHPKLAHLFEIVNFTQAGVFAAVAIHNTKVRPLTTH